MYRYGAGKEYMQKVAQFLKVSRQNFLQAMKEDFPEYTEEDMMDIYESIELPARATKGSAGYDFHAPFAFSLPPGGSIKIPTGIRVKINDGWVLKLYPRSGLGIRYRMQLDNTVGIIDGDYFYADNEGHIMARITNDSKEGKTLSLEMGVGFMQGIFLEYGITQDDDSEGVRNGGFGSTGQ